MYGDSIRTHLRILGRLSLHQLIHLVWEFGNTDHTYNVLVLGSRIVTAPRLSVS